MRVTWCTDVHLNFIRYPKAFGEELLETRPDAVLLTGDIAECPSLERCLDSLAQGLGKVVPVWFVLGNHDAYYGSVVKAKANARRVSRLGIGPLYLGMADQDAIDLGNDTWLVGVDGWYDARSGNPFGSRVEMSDFDLVSELKIAGFAEERRPGQIAACRRLAMVESDLAKAKLKAVMRNHPKRVVFATHVSPFVESTFHEGQISNSDWLPW